ncbi:ribonuclease H-like domain-containing protein [Tanacetum coccineum]
MVLRSKSGSVKPVNHLSLHTLLISHILKSPFLSIKDPYWCNAMYDEYNALVKNRTWILVSRPSDVNLVYSIWLFEHKFHVDGILSRYKACLVTNGSSQQLSVDFDETFSLIVKLATIHTILSLVVSRRWSIHQLDIKNAFLNEIFIWTKTSTSCLDLVGSQVAYLLIYVDGIILTASSPALLQQIIDSLHIDTESKLGPKDVPIQDLTLYRSLAGGLQYLTSTRPDLSYAVQQICFYMHDPREPHFACLKRILRYVQGTLYFGLHLYASATTSLGVANVVAKNAWLRNLLHELHSPLSTAILVYYDNVSAIYMSANPVQHQRMKHIEIDIHYVPDMITAG